MAAAAAASSSSPVFLNFCDEDTGNFFISHLSAALVREGLPVSTIEEYEEMRKAAKTSAAIEQSKLSILVISPGYARSQPCLDELVSILKQRETEGQIVILVFYHVNPDDFEKESDDGSERGEKEEKLSGEFGKAFEKFAKNFPPSKRADWRAALMKSATICGEVISANQKESAAVEKIAEQVSGYLIHLFPPPSLKGLVGIQYRVEQLKSRLHGIESCDIVVVGVLAMVGGGKSSVVDQLFLQIGGEFDGCHTIKGISEEVIDKDLSCMKDKGWKKVLISLDGVDKAEHVELLLRQGDWIGRGSRIVVTTGDEHVIDVVAAKLHGRWKHRIRFERYKVGGLSDAEALGFLVSKTFDGIFPPDAFLESLNKVVAYAEGNPYALQELGRRLIGLGVAECESMVRKLDRMADVEIQRKMESSFCQLPKDLKDVFLDIACFFVGERVVDRKIILAASYDIDVDTVVLALEKKLLITTDGGLFGVHNLYQAMAKEIVRKESRSEAGDRSRLWNHEDVRRVLIKNTGSSLIEGMYLDICKTKEVYLQSDVFTSMDNLRIFKFYVSCLEPCGDHSKVHANQGLESLPGQPMLLHWHKYPLKSLPSDFILHNLVEIHLAHSKLEWLWKGIEWLPNLTWINLSHSPSLKEMPDLSKAPKLKSIVLAGCTKIADIPSLAGLERLENVNLAGCSSLVELPKLPLNPNLVLILDGTLLIGVVPG